MIILHINLNILILYNVYKMYVSCIFYKIFKYNYILLFLVVFFLLRIIYIKMLLAKIQIFYAVLFIYLKKSK